MKYEAVIGLEIHCELKTKTKIFWKTNSLRMTVLLMKTVDFLSILILRWIKIRNPLGLINFC